MKLTPEQIRKLRGAVYPPLREYTDQIVDPLILVIEEILDEVAERVETRIKRNVYLDDFLGGPDE